MNDITTAVFLEIIEPKVTGTKPNRKFAGYSRYYRMATGTAMSDTNVVEKIKAIVDGTDTDQPVVRRVRHDGHGNNYDSSISLLAESGKCLYVFFVGSDQQTTFDSDQPIVPIDIPGDLGDRFITNVESYKLGGGQFAGSFVVDCDAVKNSKLAKAVKEQPHNTAVRLPFCLNLMDTKYKFPQWAIDDHEYPHHVDHQHPHDHEDDHDAGRFTHGGIHPPGVAGYVIVELA